MNIGDKKIWKKGHATFKLERIAFDWKALMVYLLIILLLIWYIVK